MIRFKNALLLKRDKNGNYYAESGDLITDGGRIVFAGKPARLPSSIPATASQFSIPDSQFTRVVDARGNLLMPGLKNCHTHSAMALLRGAGDGLPLKRWLFDCIFPLEAKLTPEDCYYAVHSAVAEYLAAGITAVQDMYFFPDETALAVNEAGFQCMGVGSSSDLDGKTEESLIKQEEFLKKYPPGGAFWARAGFHAEYTASDALLCGVKELSDKFDSPVRFHLSETETEVAECLARTGKTPPERIASNGLFDRGGAAYHCVHLRDNDLKYFKTSQFFIVSNPRSNLKLGSGIAPLAKYLSHGIKIALGTDGAASNNRLSIFDEMNTAGLLAQMTNDKGQFSILNSQFLDMSLYDGAFAMGLADACALEPGMRADIIMVDINRPNMRPRENLISSLVYSASGSNVLTTMIGGKILYENGEYKNGVDYGRVGMEFAKSAKRIFNK